MRERLFHFVAGEERMQFESPNVLFGWSKMERHARTQGVADEFKRLPIVALDGAGAEIATRTWDDWHAALMADIDPGIRPHLEKLWAAGYTTESSCSGLSCDHAPDDVRYIDGVKYILDCKGPSLIFTEPNQKQTKSILFAARWSLGAAYTEEWFGYQRAHVFWRFNSQWFYPWVFLLPLRWQDLSYSMCLKIFVWLLVRR